MADQTPVDATTLTALTVTPKLNHVDPASRLVGQRH